MPDIRYEPRVTTTLPEFLTGTVDHTGRLHAPTVANRISQYLAMKDFGCAELAAGDGRVQPLVQHFLQGSNAPGLVVEGSRSQHEQSRSTYSSSPRVTCLRRTLTYPEDAGTIDAMIGEHLPEGAGVLSIRLFGPDWHALEALQATPRLLVVMFNPTFPANVEYVQETGSENTGNSLLSVQMLARAKGYELVAVSEFQAFFVQAADLPRFGLDDNSVDALWDGGGWQSRLFQGMDGTLFLAGNQRLLWNRLPEYLNISHEDIQPLPKEFRRLFP